MLSKFFYHYASPQHFYPLAGRLWPWFALGAAGLGLWGLWLGFFVAPTDFQQGEGYRIIFVHVPVSWMSMIIYLAMAFWALLGLTLNTRLSGMMCRALAPTGAICAFLSLWTGALWGKPMWGAWWIWDARLTSELVLLLLYLAILVLQQAYQNQAAGDKLMAILSLVGLLDLPIIHYSVYWWNTLHQGASLMAFAKPAIHASMLYPLLMMIIGFFLYAIYMISLKSRNILLAREYRSKWVQALLEENIL